MAKAKAPAAKKVTQEPQAATLDELQAIVTQADEQIARLEQEREEALRKIQDELQATAEKYGLAIVRKGEKAKAGRPAKAASKASGGGKPEVAKWLQESLKDGAMPEKELRDAFKEAGMGERLRLSGYSEIVQVKDGKVSLK